MSFEPTARVLPSGHSNAVYTVDISSDGMLIASGGLDHRIKVWKTADLSLVRSQDETHGDGVTKLRFLPGGKQMVTSGLDQAVKVWDTSSGSIEADLRGHGQYITCVQVKIKS